MRRPLIIRIASLYRRRAATARVMAAHGYGPADIGRLLRLSPGRVVDALAGRAENGRLWSEQERSAFRAEMRRAA
ncbi:hypothetical protein GCM10007301_15260 [Azorhizobium oxalatiphilum]|uniref:Uncharacterized protein n=1 Tax=Azorhizobium oxalatiphilum TaxID=980631 RepID=A0A917BVT0_9HYPH|nr:hypothetical protein [Azorhizobium oxalatiphilum]GGF56549.1 hypothetical protein GCM10007301_15260 [Azorhizobium oxalatiphilum]